MGSDSSKTKKYSVVEGSKEHFALLELQKGQDYYNHFNYFEANNHYIKSLLFPKFLNNCDKFIFFKIFLIIILIGFLIEYLGT